MLSSEYCGIIRAMWGCGEGHDYVMSTDSDCSSLLVDTALSVKRDLPKAAAAQLDAGNGVAADRVVGTAATAPEPQQSLARTGASRPPASTGTALPALSTENPLPPCQELPSLQAETGAALQEKCLPQPACPLNGGPGKRCSWTARVCVWGEVHMCRGGGSLVPQLDTVPSGCFHTLSSLPPHFKDKRVTPVQVPSAELKTKP